MKITRSTVAMIAVIALVVVVAAVLLWPARKFETALLMQGNGLKSLTCNGVEYLSNGEFRVHSVTLRKPSGEVYPGATDGPVEVDVAARRLTKTLPWGKIDVEYTASGNQVALTITTTNASGSESIKGLQYEPVTLKFPDKVKEYDGSTPLLAHNVGDVALVKVSAGSTGVTVLDADVDKPLMIGFPWADNRPHNTVFPLDVHTDRVANYPDSYPTINRSIPPKGTDQYHVLLRFGRAGASELEMGSDIYKKFGEAFPSRLNWPDRRPIGVIFLATTSQNWPSNPRGWLSDSTINIGTPTGRAEFRQKLLARADATIAILKSMRAQGVITWDIEGQERQTTIGFVGDPRKVNDLAPEMGEVVDNYFSRFKTAGLRTGVVIRAQQLVPSPDKKSLIQTTADDPAQVMIDKIRYAKDHWGISFAYIDSNTNSEKDPNPIDAAAMEKVAAAFPDVLLIPEYSNLRYYGFSAPYRELRLGIVSTPETARAAYPGAFTLINTTDGPIDLYRKNLAASVKRGDVLMYRSWYADPQNEKLKTLVGP